MIGEAGDGTAGSEFGQEKPAHTIRFPEILLGHYLLRCRVLFSQQNSVFLSRIPTAILNNSIAVCSVCSLFKFRSEKLKI
jgi:hypothetical protein